ncbi:MAG TPA: PilZ domain-containing protein [Candidatus Eisenbacteria bacterium]|nr:PilZ domain-containing protein [Candidatus Eisenbacteria bacterium]
MISKPLHTTKMPVPSQRPALNRPPTAEERRRAQRVLLRIAVRIYAANKTIEAFTHTVSASGAMIIMREPLPEGTKFTIENVKTQAKVEARVARPPQPSSEGSLVPVEFATPSPKFWNVFFPPSVN